MGAPYTADLIVGGTTNAPWGVYHGAEIIKTFTSEAEAMTVAALMNTAWNNGASDARRRVRVAMGLHENADGTASVYR